jgi:hypothetical protein
MASTSSDHGDDGKSSKKMRTQTNATTGPATELVSVTEFVHLRRTIELSGPQALRNHTEIVTWTLYAILRYHGFQLTASSGAVVSSLPRTEVFASSLSYSLRFLHQPDYDAIFQIKCVPIGSVLMITAKVVSHATYHQSCMRLTTDNTATNEMINRTLIVVQ